MFILKINGLSVDMYLNQMRHHNGKFCDHYCRLKGYPGDSRYDCPHRSLYYNLQDHTFKMISTNNIIFDENKNKTRVGPFICAGFVLDKKNDEKTRK